MIKVCKTLEKYGEIVLYLCCCMLFVHFKWIKSKVEGCSRWSVIHPELQVLKHDLHILWTLEKYKEIVQNLIKRYISGLFVRFLLLFVLFNLIKVMCKT